MREDDHHRRRCNRETHHAAIPAFIDSPRLLARGSSFFSTSHARRILLLVCFSRVAMYPPHYSRAARCSMLARSLAQAIPLVSAFSRGSPQSPSMSDSPHQIYSRLLARRKRWTRLAGEERQPRPLGEVSSCFSAWCQFWRNRAGLHA